MPQQQRQQVSINIEKPILPGDSADPQTVTAPSSRSDLPSTLPLLKFDLYQRSSSQNNNQTETRNRIKSNRGNFNRTFSVEAHNNKGTRTRFYDDQNTRGGSLDEERLSVLEAAIISPQSKARIAPRAELEAEFYEDDLLIVDDFILGPSTEMNYHNHTRNSAGSGGGPKSPPIITIREASSSSPNRQSGERDDISLYGTPKEEINNPILAEAKASFMRSQIEALFQPSDNKLAMKLFGSKKALMNERLRQKESGHWIIHPCSTFRFVPLTYDYFHGVHQFPVL